MDIENLSFNYDIHGKKYSTYRQTDARIAQYITEALGSTQTVLNVGAGSGSYEPNDRYIVAVEPYSSMRQQRLKSNKVPAVIGTAASLPFDEDSFDASMATLTISGKWDEKFGSHRNMPFFHGALRLIVSNS